MALSAGSKLGPFEVLSPLGAGGMGEVYRARDVRLDREVAIKVLPEAMVSDPERVARFQREAKLSASLNHPNIAAIHGFEEHESNGRSACFLVLEFVAGETLAVRLKRGPMPVEETLHICRQIADALESAHDSGVIHRDLKPGNIMIRHDDSVKVLDFGLAKAITDDSSMSAPSNSPTITANYTRPGVILGTAAYMSPEQARGRPLDKRTDIWSFGAVLYECLTGESPFAGETVSDSIGAIMHKEIDLTRLPPGTPSMVRHVLRRCLERDRKNRLRDIGDARVELEYSTDHADDSVSRHERGASRLPWVLVALSVLAIAWLTASRSAPRTETSYRLTIPVPAATQFGDQAASPPVISPDGRHVVFGVQEPGGKTRLWLRRLDEFTARPLNGTDGAAYAFWSPDSRHVAYFRGGRLRRIEVQTGREQAIGGAGAHYPRGGSWNARGEIVLAPNANSGIHVIDAAGGTARPITHVDPAIPDGSHRWPFFLPDGQRFLFTVWTNDLGAREQVGGVYLGSLSGDEPPRRLTTDASSAVFARPSHLLVVRGDNLVAIPFDVGAGAINGEPAVVASGVLRNLATGHATFSASNDLTLVYAGGQAFVPSTFSWYDRSGVRTPVPGEPDAIFTFRIAPDSSRAAIAVPGQGGDGEIWILDLARGVRTRVAESGGAIDYPAWSADGDSLLYSAPDMGLYVRLADGSGNSEPVLVDKMDKILYDWSLDERFVAFWPLASGSGTPDIWIYSVDSASSAPCAVGEATYENARFSPDGRWLAYVSDDSGRREIFVQELRDTGDARTGARVQVSTAGGDEPHWRADGLEITYVDPQDGLMAVALEPRDGKLRVDTPQQLFTLDGPVEGVDAASDHERFLVATRVEVHSEPLHVILNWPSGYAP